MSDFDPAKLSRLAQTDSDGRLLRPPAAFENYAFAHRDAIVIALQARTVTTVAELDALPDDTVIRSRLGEVFTVDENRWLGQDGTDDTQTEHIDLPATVLWIPGS